MTTTTTLKRSGILKKVFVFTGAMFMFGIVSSGDKAQWGYSGVTGPEHWATLSADYAACAGANQSPINLTGFIEAELEPIVFRYDVGGHEIVNNGHAVQVNYKRGSHIKIDGVAFHLLQFHLHAPSENHINGRSYPLEAHLVHADDSGNLAVIAVMFEEGAANKALTKTGAMMPKHGGERHTLQDMVAVDDLLPESRDYYRFNGSLTTPPCSEGVRWLVMKQPMTATVAQINAFKSVLHEPNNRPLQAVNARAILK